MTGPVLLIGIALLSASCATTKAQPLPPLPKDSSPELQGAYQGVRTSYEKCNERYLEAQAPWQLYPAVGGGVVAVASVGTAAGLMTVQSFDAGTRAGVVGGLGALGLLGAGVASLMTDSTFGQWDRADAYQRSLQLANDRVGEAIAASNALALTELTRILNEDCRVVDLTTGEVAAATVIKDMDRWRDHVAKIEAQRTSLGEELATSREGLFQAESGRGKAEQRLAQLEGAMAQQESQNASLRGELRRLEEEQALLSKAKQKLLDDKRKLEEKNNHYEELAKALETEVKDGRVALRRLRDGVIVEMPNKVLFPSGSAELNEMGQKTLAAVGGAIKEIKDRRIRIEGHTDNVPTGKNVSYASNWELSAARAITVTKFLQEQGVTPSLMSAEARSEYAPIAKNSSATGRARNRRIEIYLVPKPVGDKEAVDLGVDDKAE
ncbi:MAG: OmpA family protein [Pseudomonadota bacterium]